MKIITRSVDEITENWRVIETLTFDKLENFTRKTIQKLSKTNQDQTAEFITS